MYKIDKQGFSTGNSIQYLAITYNEKESEKEYTCMNIYIYIYLDHFVIHLKLTQYCKSTIVQ